MNSKYKFLTASGQVKARPGSIVSFFVSAASATPTLQILDGISGTVATAVAANGTITGTGTFSDGEKIVIGSPNNPKTYIMRTALSVPAIANEILIGANLAASLTNIKAAINGSAGSGTTYSTGTVAHIEVTAGTLTGTTLQISAVSGGTAGNNIATTTTAANSTWGAATLTGGLQAIDTLIDTFTPVAGQQYYLGDTVATQNGLYVNIGGTVKVTVFYD